MTKTFSLLDHRCSGLEELLKEKKVCYEWAVCDCSPLERDYKLLQHGEWKPIVDCPSCGAPMKTLLLQIPNLLFNVNVARQPEMTSLPLVNHIGTDEAAIFRCVCCGYEYNGLWDPVGDQTKSPEKCPKCGSVEYKYVGYPEFIVAVATRQLPLKMELEDLEA